ncbi:MAG: hypothetical protein HC933_05885 [Pleurocapsa sp. SU_196_0]|nr:hypothetical protein [Pleurocapsa sp. SU_196_0]
MSSARFSFPCPETFLESRAYESLEPFWSRVERSEACMSEKPMDEAGFKAGAAKVTEADAKRVVSHAERIIDKVLSSETLKKLLEDVRVLVALVRDFVTGKYTDVPWGAVASVVFALLYLSQSGGFHPGFHSDPGVDG